MPMLSPSPVTGDDLDALLARIRAAGAAATPQDQGGLFGPGSSGGGLLGLLAGAAPSAAPQAPTGLLGGVPTAPQPTYGPGLLGDTSPPDSLLPPAISMQRQNVGLPDDDATASRPTSRATDPAQPPSWGKRGFLGDLADNLFLGGAIQRTRLSERERSIADFQTQRMAEVWNGLSPQQRAAFAANPKEFGKALADNFATHTVAGGSTLVPGAGMRGSGPDQGAYTAPLLTSDNGRFVTQTPDATTITGFSGPKVGANGVDERTGRQFPVASTVVVPLGSSVHGVTQAGNAIAQLPQIGGSGLGDLGGGASGLPSLPGASSAGSASAGASVAALGKGAPVANAIRSAASRAGLSDEDGTALVAIARQESGLNPGVRNNHSSTGLFQFHPATFKAAGGQDITNPQQQIDAAVRLYGQNRQALAATLGRQPTTSELYLAHQQGIVGAKALLAADPNAKAVDVLAPTYGGNAKMARKAVTGNAGAADATVGQFLNGWAVRMGKQVAAASRIHDGPAGAQPSSGAPASAQPGAGGFSGFSDSSPTAQPQGPHLLQSGDPRLAQFAPGAAVEDDGIGHLKPMEGTGYTPAALNEIYTRNTKDLAEYTGVVPLVRALRKSNKDNTAAADLSMVEAAARVFNPKATVRQGVMKAFDDTNGLPDTIVGAMNQLRGGGANARLSPQTRQAIVKQAEERAAILRQSAQPIIDAQTTFAKRHGISLGDILPPVEELGAATSGSAPAQPRVGEVRDGYRFLGGRAGSPSSWQKVR